MFIYTERTEMPLINLSNDEKKVVFECLKAAAEGPFFPDREFHTLFGLERSEVAQILSDWPDIDDQDMKVRIAINNSMNNLIGYPHNCEKVWDDYISVSLLDVKKIFSKWRDENI